MNRSLSHSVILYVSCLLVVVGGGFTYINNRTQRGAAAEQLRAEARSMVGMLSAAAGPAIAAGDVEHLDTLLAEARTHRAVDEAFVFDVKGRVLGDGTMSGRKRGAKLSGTSVLGDVSPATIVLEETEAFLSASVGVFVEHRFVGGVRVDFSKDAIAGEIRFIERRNMIVGLACVIMAIVLTRLSVRRITGPLRRLEQGAQRVAEGDFETVIQVESSNEIGTVAAALNSMIENLRQTTVSKEYLDSVLRGINQGLFVIRRDGRIRAVNPTGLRLLGYSEHELVGQPVAGLFDDDAAPLVRSILGLFQAKEEQAGRHVEAELCRREGGRVHVILSFSRFEDRAGKIDGVVCVAQELTRLLDAENRLHLTNSQLQLLNRMTAIALHTTEYAQVLRQMVETIRYRGGYPAVGIAITTGDEDLCELEVADGFEITGPGDVERQVIDGSVLDQAARHGVPVVRRSDDHRFTFRDSRLLRVRAELFCVFPMSVEGRLRGALVIASNSDLESSEDFVDKGADLARHIATLLDQKLTNQALRKSNLELEHARRAAEEASRSKSEFLANMSHEIRTPMTAILGYTELFGDASPDDLEQRGEFIRTIRRNGEHLLSILNDILDLSKIEAGKMSIERVACSPVEIVSEVVDMMRGRAEEKGLRLEVRYEGPIPRVISSDPTRLRQVLVNLVGNAVKFADSGSVSVILRRGGESEPRKMIFDVVDTGIGISATQLTQIFRPFTQADNSYTRRFGGTGLGLPISQRLAALLGGGIAAQSRKGEGSTFSVHIDGGSLAERDFVDDVDGMLAASKDSVSEPKRGIATRLDADILLAEDGRDNQRLISRILEKQGARVTVVADGQTAIEAALEALEEKRPFDLILMDMQMPVCDGYTATGMLREVGYDRPIVALTAHAMAGDRERCLQAGCDAYTPKPIDRAELIDLAARYSSPGATGD